MGWILNLTNWKKQFIVVFIACGADTLIGVFSLFFLLYIPCYIFEIKYEKLTQLNSFMYVYDSEFSPEGHSR